MRRDGKNAWLEGSAHVSYPSEGQYDGGGKCPDTHPYRLMSVSPLEHMPKGTLSKLIP